MKTINGVLFTLAILILIFFNSCSSPETQGKEVGEKFCNALDGFKLAVKPSDFQHRLDSCNKLIKVDWDKYENDYKKDASKWKEFIASYNNTTEYTLKDFNSSLQECCARIESSIKNQLNEKLWVKKNDNTNVFLYSFTDNKLSMYNCKDIVNFKLVADTIRFDDETLTTAIVSFDKIGNLILTSCKNQNNIKLQPASIKDKLLGSWSVTGGTIVKFYPNGRCSVGGNGYLTEFTQYSFNNNILQIVQLPAYKVSLSNPNQFISGQAIFQRNKYSKPKSLEQLFFK